MKEKLQHILDRSGLKCECTVEPLYAYAIRVLIFDTLSEPPFGEEPVPVLDVLVDESEFQHPYWSGVELPILEFIHKQWMTGIVTQGRDLPYWSVVNHNSGGGITLKTEDLLYADACALFTECIKNTLLTDMIASKYHEQYVAEYHEQYVELLFSGRLVMYQSVGGWF